jgi:hypothetical protein
MNAKHYYNFWRPVMAIQEGDIGANPDTIADPNWLPLATTPNHPEYPAAHGCVTGAVPSVIAAYFGTSNVSLHVTATYAIPAALGGGLLYILARVAAIFTTLHNRPQSKISG